MKITLLYACITMLFCAVMMNIMLLRGILVIPLPAVYTWMPIIAKVVVLLAFISIIGLLLLTRDRHPNKD